MTVIDPAVPVAPTGPPANARTVRFTGDVVPYWRLLIRGAVLLAITLGMYRFWLATDIRRYLWSHTEINGDSLGYTGTALELLIGFLIAIAVIIPINLAFFVATLSLGSFGEAISALAFPLLAFLGQYAVYRARRYRLTRTVFRGVRFYQDDSAWRYAVCAMFWWVMIALTLGLAYPFAQSRLERFKMRHTHYGSLPGRFEGSGLRLFLRGLPMWILTVGPLLFAVVFAIINVDWTLMIEAIKREDGDFASRIESAAPGFYAAIVVAIVASIISVAMAVVLFPVFQAMVLRWWLSGVRFGELSVASHLRTGLIYGAYARFLLYGLLFTIGALVLAAAGAAALYLFAGSLNQSELTEIVWAGAAILFYVIVMLGYSTIYQATVKLSLWRYGAESCELQGLAALDQVKAAGAPSSAVGEGLADALNVGGF